MGTTNFKEEINASQLVDDDMKVFADYTIATKFPHYLDGLKAIARRIVVTLHRMPGTPKELSVGGEIVKMHPHGDSSINSAISVMAQPFSHVAPLVFSESNVGTYDGEKPAGARYVDVAESEIAKALFYDDTNENVMNMVTCESEDGVEPEFLIPRIPTALMVPNFAIAVGYQSRIPGFAIPELCKLTKEYIKLRATTMDWQAKARRQLVKYMIPDFPTKCIIRNGKKLIEEYKKGNFDAPVMVDGIFVVTKDTIFIRTIPPGTSFKDTMFSVGSTMARVKNSWEAQHFQQIESFSDKKQGTCMGNYKCVVRRGMNPFDALATLKKKCQITGNFNPIRNYTDYEGHLRHETPLTLLDAWYDTRYNAVLGDLKQTLNMLVDKQRQLLALIIVRDHSEEVFKIYNNAKEDTIIPALVKRFGLTRYQAKFVGGLKFSQITAKGKDELQAELDEIKKKMDDLQNKFHRIPDLMIESIEKFERDFLTRPYKQAGMTYDLSRRCKQPKYIGVAVYRGNGNILIEDEAEFDSIIKDFDPEELDFRLFREGNEDIIALGSDEDIDEGIDLPKYIKAVYVDRVPNVKYTGCQLQKGAMVIKGLVPPQENMKFAVPIDKDFVVVEKNGHIHRELVTDKIIRKSLSAGATMKDVVHLANTGSDVVVIHGNSSQPNLLLIERVDISNGPAKLRKIPVGEWKILGIFDAYVKRIYLNIPRELRQRCTTRHIVIDNIGHCIAPGQRLNMTFGRTTAKTDFDLVPIRKKSTIFLAKKI